MKIIIDSDPGIDDAFAIYYASRCANFDILGITTTFGNHHIEQTTSNAIYLNENFNIGTKIYRGCSHPLVKPLLDPVTIVHGSNGLGDAFNIPCEQMGDNAVQFIIDSVKAAPGEITLVTLGPLTNLATAINLAPEIVPLIKQVVMMGGAFGTNGHAGNVSPVAEYNIFCDPHAADYVMQTALPLVIVGLDVTHEVIVSPEELAEITTNYHVQLLRNMSEHYFTFSKEYEGINGIRLHDALTFSYLNSPELFNTITVPVRVVCDGIADGQTIYSNNSIGEWQDKPHHNICIGVNVEQVKNHFLTTLATK